VGEIYRSASITGVRRLETTSNNVQAGKKERLPSDDHKPVRDETTKQQATHSKQESQSKSVAEAVAQAPASTGEFERLRDLSLIQKQRIVQLEEEREQLLQDCSQLADDVVRLEQKLTAGIEETTASAHEAGLRQAQEQLAAQEQTMSDELHRMRRLFQDNLQTHLQQIDELALEIAFAALTRIVGEQFGDPNFTRAVVTKALKGVRDAQKLTVHLSPSDVEIMERHAAATGDSAILAEINYVADPRVTVGGCLIETDTGVWDARLETQLQRLRDTIAKTIREGAAD